MVNDDKGQKMPTNGETHESLKHEMPGVLIGAPPNGLEEAPEPAPAEPPAAGGARTETSIDLAAWARGETNEHSLDEVRKAIEDLVFDRYVYPEITRMMDARIGPLNTLQDAVQWLIDEGIVEAHEARIDLED
jgi:hypothetical protein